MCICRFVAMFPTIHIGLYTQHQDGPTHSTDRATWQTSATLAGWIGCSQMGKVRPHVTARYLERLDRQAESGVTTLGLGTLTIGKVEGWTPDEHEERTSGNDWPATHFS